MAEHRIAFCAEDVRAFLSGRKTRISVPVVPEPKEYTAGRWDWPIDNPLLSLRGGTLNELIGRLTEAAPWQPGDRIVVLESLRYNHKTDSYHYDADGRRVLIDPEMDEPDWASRVSRLTLRVEEVGAQRLGELLEPGEWDGWQGFGSTIKAIAAEGAPDEIQIHSNPSKWIDWYSAYWNARHPSHPLSADRWCFWARLKRLKRDKPKSGTDWANELGYDLYGPKGWLR